MNNNEVNEYLLNEDYENIINNNEVAQYLELIEYKYITNQISAEEYFKINSYFYNKLVLSIKTRNWQVISKMILYLWIWRERSENMKNTNSKQFIIKRFVQMACEGILTLF